MVQNIGLQARILSTRTFTMFVVMALVTTFATTPLTTLLYPKWYQIKVKRWRRGEVDWNGNSAQDASRRDSVAAAKDQLKTNAVRKLLVYLRLDGLSSICTLAALLSPNDQPPAPKIHPEKKKQLASPKHVADESAATEEDEEAPKLQVHGVRLMELTDRDSCVMKVSEIDEYSLRDPVVNTFRAFGQWHDLSVMAGVSVVPEHSYADTVVGMTHQESTDLLLLPWSEAGTMSEHQSGLGLGSDEANRFTNAPFAEFVSTVLRQTTCNVGVLIERAMPRKQRPGLLGKRSLSGMSVRRSVWNSSGPPPATRSHHIVLPFLGGQDDRYALCFVMQLARNDQVTATIIHLDVPFSAGDNPAGPGESSTAQKVLPSEAESDATLFNIMRDSLPETLASRVVFKRVAPTTPNSETDPVTLAITTVQNEISHPPHKARNMVVVGRRNNRVAEMPSGKEVESCEDNSVSVALGAIGRAMVRTEARFVGNVLILQAGRPA